MEKKLGTLWPAKKFRDLYERARTADRHEKQFQASAVSRQETNTPRKCDRPNSVKTVESEVSVNQKPNPNRGGVTHNPALF